MDQSSPPSVKAQIQASARDLWFSVKSLEQTMKIPVVSPEEGAGKRGEGNTLSLESVMQTLFASCTTGVVPASEPESKTEAVSQKLNEGIHDPSKGNHEGIYEAIFQDKNVRAEEAVCHLRQKLEHNNGPRSPARPPSKSNLPGMFPASSPTRQREIEIPLSRNQLPPGSDHHMDSGLSFDDGISVITQHTLEELARSYHPDDLGRVHSDVTQDPIEEVEESWKNTVRPRHPSTPSRKGKGFSPVRLLRSGRSQGTLSTKKSNDKSMATKSTLSTQTTEFANAWQKEEQKYWDEIVKEDTHGSPAGAGLSRHKKLLKAREFSRRSRSRSGDMGKRDGTITTVHSSIYSGISSHERSVPATQKDPDRLMDVLVMPAGTEMGEI